MTQKEFYNAVINANFNDELTTYATDAIAKLDAAAKRKKNAPKKANPENEALIATIKEMLTAEPQTASDVATVAGVSTQKASAMLRKLVADGFAVAGEVKTPKGTVKAYSIA